MAADLTSRKNLKSLPADIENKKGDITENITFLI